MRRGTTPTFAFDIDTDLTGWDIYVTFEQGNKEITRKDPDVVATEGGCTVSVTLTQEETLAFRAERKASAQVRATKDGVALGSDIFDFEVGEILLDGVIPQEV